jgi:HSP20 family protein
MTHVVTDKKAVAQTTAAAKPAAPPATETPTLRRPRPLDLFERMLAWDPFGSMEPLLAWRGEASFAPDFTVKETKDAFVFRADVPGVDVKDLDVSFTQNRLTISGRRVEEKKDEGETFYTYERSFGAFTRAFTLPAGTNADQATADVKDGVLTVTIPKIAAAQAKRIDVKPT